MIKRKEFLIVNLLFVSLIIAAASSCNKDDTDNDVIITGTFTDSRDGNVYKTVTIGNQVWMSENLKYLPEVAGPASGSLAAPFYYVYGYDGSDVNEARATAEYTTYGVLYNWEAAVAGDAGSTSIPSGVQGICPAGWHLPADAEWELLITYLAKNGYNFDGTTGVGGDKLGKAMASTTGWTSSSNNGAAGNTDFPKYRNKSGFTALPGGYRDSDKTFGNLSINGYWWSATELNNDTAWFRGINYNISIVATGSSSKELGYSVRCLRD